MKKFFLKNRKIIYFCIIPYLFFIFLLTYPIEYEVVTPGNISDVAETINVRDKEINGSISTTYVGSISRISFFQFIIGYVNKYCDVYEMSETNKTLTNQEIHEVGVIDHNSSIDFSIMAAYKSLGITNLIGEEKIYVYTKSVDYIYDKEFPVGSEIKSVDGVTGFDNISSYLSSVSIDKEVTFNLIYKGNEVTYKLKKVLSSDGSYKFGITIKRYFSVDKSNLDIDVYESSVTGPSGGLLQALHIYCSLSDKDIVKGLKIAGTGTIDSNGNAGYIGGVDQKVATAYFQNVDVFFMPYLDENYYYDNYLEAMRFVEKAGLEGKVNIVPVRTLQDCIDYLESYGE